MVHVCFEAMNVFQSLKSSGAELNSVVYNTVLDAGGPGGQWRVQLVVLWLCKTCYCKWF